MTDRWSVLEAAATDCVKPIDCTCGGSVYGLVHVVDCDIAMSDTWDVFVETITPRDVLELIRLARLASTVGVS